MIHELLLSPTETAAGSHPCCVVSVTYHRPSYFHGGNTDSNPVGTPNLFRNLRAQAVFFAGTARMKSFVVAPVRFPGQQTFAHQTFRNLLVAAITSDVGIFMSK